jgi:hypothetical protein
MGRSYTTEQFIINARKIHGDTYNYSKAKYLTAHDDILIICNLCNKEFIQRPSHHVSGHGCSDCNKKKANISQTLSNDEFIRRSKILHGDNIFDYSYTKYEKYKKLVKLKCIKHNYIFDVKAGDHLRLKDPIGCPRCSHHLILVEDFIERANIIHNNKYNYSISNYLGASKSIDIICPIHGIFSQLAFVHLEGHGCWNCGQGSISYAENQWLDSLGVPIEYRQITLKFDKKWFKVDAYDPITNTVYEFNGDYWHGNPKVFDCNEINRNNKKTYGYLYDKTINKENIIKSAGYKLITIWEHDWRLYG